ncbi:MAG TPA: lipid-A-disaccharide synthase, partial [Gammaproteobacteria bacterium]|nr:lipid-A-disaccharide synthase [Gammaproteobacteria bacterium]
MTNTPLRIGIIAGEASGDQLAAGLITEIRRRRPDVVFEGIAGPEMEAVGCRALFPAEKLSVMGLAEVLQHLPELLRIRRQVVAHFTANPPDVFIGVDAPDFNLGVEARLKAAGIRTVHYVSPSVWAWREKRARKIGRSADLVLCLFPFEPAIYASHGVAAEFVGHPMADAIDLQTDPDICRRALNVPADKLTLAVLPGSRVSEVSRMGPLFLRTCAQLQQMQADIEFVAPMATVRIKSL